MKYEMLWRIARPACAAISLLLVLACAKQAPPPANYHEIEVTNGGSITGSVSYSGVRPSVNPIIIEKDQDVCGAMQANASDPGSGASIAGSIVYLDTITSGKPFAGSSATVQ